MVAVLALAGIVVSLMQTLVIPIVPELPKLLDAPASDTAWAVTATLLAAAVATPVVGRLGDMFGKRRMLLVSIVLLISGSVVCALGDSLVPMIIGRALQGLAAGVIPLGISIMRDELPAEKLAGSTAVMSASLGVGGALGLPTAAFIADNCGLAHPVLDLRRAGRRRPPARPADRARVARRVPGAASTSSARSVCRPVWSRCC